MGSKSSKFGVIFNIIQVLNSETKVQCRNACRIFWPSLVKLGPRTPEMLMWIYLHDTDVLCGFIICIVNLFICSLCIFVAILYCLCDVIVSAAYGPLSQINILYIMGSSVHFIGWYCCWWPWVTFKTISANTYFWLYHHQQHHYQSINQSINQSIFV